MLYDTIKYITLLQSLVGIQQEHQQIGPIGMSQQHQMRQNDVNLIIEKINKAKTDEERTAIFTELRKTPFLFNAFLKMKKVQNLFHL